MGRAFARALLEDTLSPADALAKLGDSVLRLVLESRRAAIAQLEAFVTDEHASCGCERVQAFPCSENVDNERRPRDDRSREGVRTTGSPLNATGRLLRA